MTTLQTAAGNNISDVMFMPLVSGDWLLIVTKGIWSVISVWDLSKSPPSKVYDWSPKGGIFHGVCTDAKEGRVAVGVDSEA
jgi:hypothetical protein